jgi:CubicO group peptidase (beta-lactamase class C family)
MGVVAQGGEREIEAFGRYTCESGASPMTELSVFDVASVTKAIPVSTLALMAIDRGMCGLDDKLAKWVPQFDNRYRESVTIEHVLTQTIDHGYALSSHKNLAPQDLLRMILTHDFARPPGENFCYTNATSILLGMCVERIYGSTLDRIAARHLFGPLDMHHSTFSPDKIDRDLVVPTEIDAWRGREIRAEIHDESAWVLRAIMAPGSAGLFTTVPDLLNVLEMLLAGGTRNGRRILSNEMMQRMQQNRIASIGSRAALGWELSQERFMGANCSSRTIGKTGFTGCVVICDFEKKKALALLSNYTYPARKPDADAINSVRSRVADEVFI